MDITEENRNLIATLQTTFRALYEPLEIAIGLVWRGTGQPPAASGVWAHHLLTAAQRFVDARDSSPADKQKFYEEICLLFGLIPEPETFPLARRNDFGAHITARFDQSPVALSYLEIYDRRHATRHADKARHALFQFANLISKYDGTISAEEEAALAEFKAVLFPDEVSDAVKNSAPDESSSGNRAGQKTDVRNATAETQNANLTEAVIKDEPPRPLEELLAELNALVGLERVKKEVTQLINLLKVRKLRAENQMKELPMSRHLVFYGNPGTGKTTVARLLAQIFRSLEVLSRGHLIETDRSGLVAGYVGHTAPKVKAAVEKSLGGVLFIDEAYALTPPGRENDFGSEAVETLLKLMEDHRADLIVIVAGYTEKMDEFLEANPGLRSRFNRFINFEDYSPEQLVEIFKSFAKKADYQISADGEAKLKELFQQLYALRDEAFGNARLARNIFETAISRQADRIVSLSDINRDVLATLTAEDLPTFDDLKFAQDIP